MGMNEDECNTNQIPCHQEGTDDREVKLFVLKEAIPSTVTSPNKCSIDFGSKFSVSNVLKSVT